MHPRTTTSGRTPGRTARAPRRGRRPSARRPGLYLGMAAAGALLANVLVGPDPAAQAGPDAGAARSEALDVADRLGLTSGSGPAGAGGDLPAGERLDEDLRRLERYAASRSTREAAQTEAAQARAAADQAELDRQAAEAAARAEAEARAAEEAAAAEAAAGAEAEARAAAPAPAAPAAAPKAAAKPVAAGAARISNSAGGVKPVVQAAADAVVANVPGAAGITLGGTRASAADPGGHPSGSAGRGPARPTPGATPRAWRWTTWSCPTPPSATRSSPTTWPTGTSSAWTT